MLPKIHHWVPRVCWGLAFILVLVSGYIRHLSVQHGPLHDGAAFVVGFVNSREDQWLTAACVGVYFVSLTCFRCLLRNRLAGAPGASARGIAVARWCWPEVLLGLAMGWAAVRYAVSYPTSYPRMDFLTLLAGAAAGQAVAVARLRREEMGRPGSFHQEILPLLVPRSRAGGGVPSTHGRGIPVPWPCTLDWAVL